MINWIKKRKGSAILLSMALALLFQGQTNIPIQISADRLEVDNLNNHVVFEGNVQAIREDIVINSERLEVFNNQKERKIEKILASGKVRIKQQKRLAKAEVAVYYMLEDKIVLSGHPEVMEDDNLISGKEIVILLQENKSMVKGDVKVIFYPERSKDLFPKAVGNTR